MFLKVEVIKMIEILELNGFIEMNLVQKKDIFMN